MIFKWLNDSEKMMEGDNVYMKICLLREEQ